MVDLGLGANPGLDEDPLKLIEVGSGDLPVAADLLDGELVFVGTQVDAHLRSNRVRSVPISIPRRDAADSSPSSSSKSV